MMRELALRVIDKGADVNAHLFPDHGADPKLADKDGVTG
jgi:hypothetical protein